MSDVCLPVQTREPGGDTSGQAWKGDLAEETRRTLSVDLQSSSPDHFCKKMGSNINKGGSEPDAKELRIYRLHPAGSR